MQLRSTILTSLMLSAGLFCCACGKNTPVCGAGPDTDPAFAMKMAEEHVALGPRTAGTEGAAKAAAWIMEKMSAMKEKFIVTQDVWQENGKTFRNVQAVYRGQGDRGKFVIAAAHYDTKKLSLVPDFQGANDGASGVAALLAMANALPEHSPLPFDIHFVFFDGEEAVLEYNDYDGLHGSKRCARQLKETGRAGNCVAMILLDMVGDKNLDVRFPADTNRKLLDLAAGVSETNGTLAQFNRGGSVMLDDHIPFQEIGIPAIDIIDFNYGPGNSYWHTRYDTLDKISGKSIAAAADFALDLIWALAEKQK